MEAPGCGGPAQAAAPGCVPWCAAASVLLGLPGLAVTAVAQTGDGWTAVDVVTGPDLEESARCCPECGTPAAAVKEMVTTTPRDVYLGDRQVRLRWRKKRWACGNEDCARKTFTESLPALPARARLTSRLRARLGEVIGDELMPAAAAARRYRVSDRTAALAFARYADAQLADLDEHLGPIEAARIDEFRRGLPGPARGAGKARSQWFTHLVDLGAGGTLGLAQSRTAEAGKGLLGGHVYAALLGHMLRHNIESLSAGYLATIIETLDSDGDGQQIAIVWIAKEHLRALLALRSTKTHVTPAPGQALQSLFHAGWACWSGCVIT